MCRSNTQIRDKWSKVATTAEAGQNPDDGKIFQVGHTAQGVFSRRKVKESEAEKNDERKNQSSIWNKHNHKNISLSGPRRELKRTENTDQNLETTQTQILLTEFMSRFYSTIQP